jgi:hypothetical protein
MKKYPGSQTCAGIVDVGIGVANGDATSIKVLALLQFISYGSGLGSGLDLRLGSGLGLGLGLGLRLGFGLSLGLENKRKLSNFLYIFKK